MQGITESALIESQSLRSARLDLVNVLDRVGVLVMLPDDVHATTDAVASFYGVAETTIKSLVAANRAELESNGHRTLRGSDLRRFRTKTNDSSLSDRVNALAVFSRRAVLNVGMLLRDSETAKLVRTYLLEVEELAPVDLKKTAYERLREKVEYRAFRDLIAENASDYAPNDPATRMAFADAQNVLYRSVTGMTAAQLLRSGRPIVTWTGKTGPTAQDIKVAKNYLGHKELAKMISRVTLLMAKAQVLSEDGRTLKLQEWVSLAERELPPAA